MDRSNLRNRFAYHKPANAVIGDLHSVVRTECLNLAFFIDEHVPDGREKSLAITNLEQVMMWANAALARNQ